VFSSLGDGDDTVSSPDSGNNTIVYPFLETDTDGIYEIVICAYPTWDATVTYDMSPSPEVVYNPTDGKLYKSLSGTNTGNQPDTSPLYWELYEPTQEESLLTRYCASMKIAVVCLSLISCLERLTYNAFCEIDNDFCNDDILCQNKIFLNAVKLRVLFDALEISVNKSAWNEVEREFNLMKTICNCN